MAGPQMTKVLRIGIFQGDRCIEERLIRKRVPVTVGQTLSNTFVVPASTMPKSHTLFDLEPSGQYVLRVNDQMGGRLSLGANDVIDLAVLRGVEAARAKDDGYEIKLDDKARGKVTIGETRILFQFVTAPAAATGVLPTRVGGGALAGLSSFINGPILVGMLLSALFQLAPLVFVISKDWPEPEDYMVIQPDWVHQEDLEVIADEEEEDKPEEVEDEFEGLEMAEIPSEEPAPRPRPEERTARTERNDRTSKATSSGPKSTQKSFEDRSSGKKMASSLFGVEGGESLGKNIAAGITNDSLSNLGLENLDGSAFGRGPGGESTGLDLGNGMGGSASGEPGVKELGTGGGGNNRVIGTGPSASDQSKERSKIDFKMSEDTKIPDSVAKADKSSMESVFRSKKSQVEQCYRRVIQKYGAQPGKLVVSITISADGKVLKANVTSDEVGKGLADCVVAKIQRWKFPATGSTVSVFKRWVFQ